MPRLDSFREGRFTVARAAASASAPAFGLGTRFDDRERAAAEVGAVERERLLGLLVVAELDETESLRAAAVAIGDDLGRHDFSVR